MKDEGEEEYTQEDQKEKKEKTWHDWITLPQCKVPQKQNS